MTEQEFCTRFVAEMMNIAVEDDFGELRKYAEETAPTYWADEDQRAEGPEACAQADVGYWGE